MVYHTPKQNTLQRYRIYLLWANIFIKIISRKLKFFLCFDFRVNFGAGGLRIILRSMVSGRYFFEGTYLRFR